VGMTILFYIEPVVFRRHPGLLGAWVEWVRRIAVANPDEKVCLASSHSLLDAFGRDSSLTCFAIPLTSVLRSCDFSRVRYAEGLFRSPAPENQPLSTVFEAIAEACDPDVVISFTQNPWLKPKFPRASVLFMELGVWPRLGVPYTFFLDRLGHQDGLLNQAWERIEQARPPLSVDRADALWAAHTRAHVLEHPAYPVAREWMAAMAPRKRRVLALQPPDWVTYEGLVGSLAPEELIYAQAFDDPDAVLIPTYHSEHRLDEAMEVFIGGEFPNVVFPPPEIATGVTELLVALADEVITVSSTSAVSAILSGVPVRVLGLASFTRAAEAMNAAAGDPAETARLRRNLLAVLSNRFLHLADRCLDEQGYFSQVVAQLSALDPISPYLDFSDWTDDRLEVLLGLD
jgi:hypothetical protein